MIRALHFLAVCCVWMAGTLTAHADVTIQQVSTASGMTAWLVEDYTVPIVTLRLGFAGGSRADPVGHSGLSYLMSGLMDEGAGDMPAAAYQSALDDAGVELSFFTRTDHFGTHMRFLKDDVNTAFDLLHLAITHPRFDPTPVERIRRQILSGLNARRQNPDTQANLVLMQALYGDHPAARSRKGNIKEVAALTVDDLRAFHAVQFARDRLHIVVVGAIGATDLGPLLEKTFGTLPVNNAHVNARRPSPNFGDTLHVDTSRSSTAILSVYPGWPEDHPDHAAALVLNYLFGGASFASRLFQTLRTDRGWVYGVSSALDTTPPSPQLVVTTQAQPDKVDDVLALINGELQALANTASSPDDLAQARAYLKGVFYVRNFQSSTSIAQTLLRLQLDGHSPTYVNDRAIRLDEVSSQDVQTLARQLLNTAPTTVLTGPK